jgi:acyl-CoA thioester hydrolase
VLERDIDHMGHVNNAVYIQWAQMVTQSFWESRATPQMVEETLWVALRHEIDYNRPILFGDRVHVGLRLISTVTARAAFECLIHLDDQPVARLMSTWCCVDAASRKPKRISDSIRVTFGT